MIYNVSQFGVNKLSVNYDVPDDQYILMVLRVPCYSGKSGQEKAAILDLDLCDGLKVLSFDGVEAIYEDLLDGMIYFSNIGTWDADLYYQDNGIYTDPLSATYLDTIQLQVNYG